MKNFGKLIKDSRIQSKCKLTEVANVVNIDKALLSKLEKGLRLATHQQAQDLIAYYKLDEKTSLTIWLSDKILKSYGEEPYLLDALIVAEEQIKYTTVGVKIDTDKELDKLLKKADALHKKWASKKPLDKFQLQKMNEHYNMMYTYESNKIEGNTLTLQETFLVVNQGLTIGGKSMNEHLEAVNHAEAIDFIVSLVKNNEKLSERVLKEIHYLILKGINKANAGSYRKVPVYIGGSSFVPPQPYLVNKMIEDVFIYYQKNKSKIHPIILAADMHEKIVTVHPFIDGNGRTCRLVMNLILLANGFPIAILKGDNKSRQQYYDALNSVQLKNSKLPFYKLVTQACIDSLNEHIKMAG